MPSSQGEPVPGLPAPPGRSTGSLLNRVLAGLPAPPKSGSGSLLKRVLAGLPAPPGRGTGSLPDRVLAGPEYGGQPFVLFSASHLAGLGTILFAGAALYLLRSELRLQPLGTVLRISFASLLLANELALSLWRLRHRLWSPADSLPLHLCGLAVLLSAAMLITRSYRLYEICYFWGLAGATQALITPDVGRYGFPHFRFFQCFVSHGLIVTAVLFMTLVEGMRPDLGCLLRALLALNLYAAFIGMVNLLLKANYGFVCRKPEDPSLIDVLGPWPWYLLSLEAAALIGFFLVYLPFLFL